MEIIFQTIKILQISHRQSLRHFRENELKQKEFMIPWWLLKICEQKFQNTLAQSKINSLLWDIFPSCFPNYVTHVKVNLISDGYVRNAFDYFSKPCDFKRSKINEIFIFVNGEMSLKWPKI